MPTGQSPSPAACALNHRAIPEGGYRRCAKCCTVIGRVRVSGDGRMTAKQHWMRFACAVAVATVTIGSTVRSAAAAPPAASTSSTSTESPMLAAHEPRTGRFLYAVNQAAATRGSISVYDISAGHRLVKTIETVRDVDDVKGVAASAATGRLYVAYRTRSGVGKIGRASCRER